MLLGIWAAPKEDATVSSAEAVYVCPLILPGQLQDPTGAAAPTCHGPPIPLCDRSYADVARSGTSVLDGVDWVYLRRGPPGGPLEQAYSGPFRVLARSDKVFRLQMGERVETVTADRLKPHTGAEPVPRQPPRRGRLPGTGGGN